MKNPLVDALRNATAEDEANPCPEALQPTQDKTNMAGASLVELPLDLVASTVLTESTESDDIECTGDESCIEALSAVTGESARVQPDNETCLLPILNEDSLPEMSDYGSSPGIVIENSVGEETQPMRHWLVRLGLWSPAIALLAMSTAAGAYIFYQQLTAQHLNFDLSESSLRIEKDVRDQGASRAWSNLPENNVNADTEGYVSLQALGEPQRSTSMPASRASPLEPVEYEHSPVSAAGAASRRINDPAFTLVQSGFAAYQAGDYAGAAEHYRHALAVDENHRHALVGLAAALQKSAGPEEWIPVYEKLLALNPNDAVAASVLLAHQVRGNPQREITQLKVLLQKYPEVAVIHHALGLLAGEHGHWAEARLAFLNAHRLAPGDANYSFNVAVSMQHLGQYVPARSYYQLALATADQNDLVNEEMITRQLQILAASAGDSP